MFPIHISARGKYPVIFPCVDDVIVTRKQTSQMSKYPQTDTTEMKIVNTKRKTESDIRIFTKWDSTEDIGVEEMNMHLTIFCSARTKSKEENESDSLKCIQASINIL